jgi:transposase
MKHTLIAVDLAKNVFEIAVSERPGVVTRRRRLRRSKFLEFFVRQEPTTVVLEACGSAHHWGRKLGELGHRVVLLPPHLVHPYVTRNKTDRSDAKGLLEAYRNKEIPAVPIKSLEQQGLTALHRLRSAWQAERTARINSLRGILREFGLTIPLGANNVVPHVWAFLEDAETPLPDFLRPALAEAAREVRQFEERVKGIEAQLKQLVKQSALAQRLLTIPGVGLITATALIAFVGNVERFRSARRFASYLGLTPSEHSSGSKRRLGRISKRGDVYLRMLLIHGARAALFAARRSKQPPDRLRVWALKLRDRAGHNRAAVALANKLARIVWATWRREVSFVSSPIAA